MSSCDYSLVESQRFPVRDRNRICFNAGFHCETEKCPVSKQPPESAIRFTPPIFDAHDPIEFAVDLRDDVPGGCVIYGRFGDAWNHETWHCNVSARSLVRLLLSQVDHYSAPPTCGACGAEITSNVYCLGCCDVSCCDSCGDRGCPDCAPGAR